MKRFLSLATLSLFLALLILVPLTVAGSNPVPLSSTIDEGSARKTSEESCNPDRAGRPNPRIAGKQNKESLLARADDVDEIPCGLTVAEYVRIGDVAEKDGDLQTSVRALTMAVETGGAPAEVYKRLVHFYLELGDDRSAIAALRPLSGARPADAQLHFYLGLLKAVTEPDSALADLSLAAEIDPSLGDFVRSFRRSIKTARLAEDPAFSLVTAGRSLASIDEWELASQAFRNASALRPDYAEAWAFLGESRQHLGENGLPDLKKALALDPDSISANILLGLYWERQERFDLALVYVHQAADLDPDNPDFQAELGQVLASLGDLSTAFEYYRKATELAPQDPEYYRQLAGFCIHYEHMAREIGLPAARQAVLIDPKDPASLDLMAQVLAYLGDPLSALRFSERALAADPSYAPAHLHLGVVYIFLKERTLAREQLDLARTLAPGSPTADQARRLIDQIP